MSLSASFQMACVLFLLVAEVVFYFLALSSSMNRFAAFFLLLVFLVEESIAFIHETHYQDHVISFHCSSSTYSSLVV